MIEYILNDHISLLAIIALIIVFITYLLLDNGRLFSFDIQTNSQTDENKNNSTAHVKSAIFYRYNHQSEKDWLFWINSQKKIIKSQAFKLLKEHLEGPSKHWGSITLEALGVLPDFKNEGAEHILARFFVENGRLWGEYKNTPNYYTKAANLIAEMNPQLALKYFSSEFDRKSNLQAEIERKTIIIEALPKLDSLGVGMIISIINRPKEVFIIKSHALRVAAKFNEDSYHRIIIEVLKNQINRFAVLSTPPQSSDLDILEDVFKQAAKHISNNNFFNVFELACKANSMIHNLALKVLIKRIREAKDQLTTLEIYAMTLLNDDADKQLGQELALIHELETPEIENLCLPLIKEGNISEELLKTEELANFRLPIPRAFEKQYNAFKKLFEQPSTPSSINCQKAYGGVLITGDNELEKLYFAKAFAQESNLNFGYANIAEINGKDDYIRLVNIFTNLRKPYLLYISQPELMYPSDKSPTANYRLKFGQTLYIQALDTKSFLVGSIKKSTKEIQSETILIAISQLKTTLFAQMVEMNKRDEKFKLEVVENYFSIMNPRRLDPELNLVNQIYEKNKNLNCLEFAFLALKTLKTMLLVYGRVMPLENLNKLESKLISIKTEQ